jgi:hypothetical protein
MGAGGEASRNWSPVKNFRRPGFKCGGIRGVHARARMTRPAVVLKPLRCPLFPECRDYARSAMRFEAETQSVVTSRLRKSTMVNVVNRIKIRLLTELVEQGGDGALRHRKLSTVFFRLFDVQTRQTEPWRK